MGSEKERGYDLRNVSFDQFVDFFFNHPDSDWYTDYYCEEEYDPAQCIEYYIRLFRNPGFLLDRYSHIQLEQAFWAIASDFLAVSVPPLLLEAKVPLVRREECIRAMYYLYRDLFSIHDMDTSDWMWWDLIVTSHEFYANERGDDEHPVKDANQLRDVMFETLCEILKLPSMACQAAALHGFNHLRHRDTETILRRFLKEHPELDDKAKDFVEICIRGEHQ